MDKPDTTEKIIDQIWQMLSGFNDDGMYHEFKELTKKIDAFINNSGSFRLNTCPNKDTKQMLENHIKDHENNKDIRFKRWQMIAVWIGLGITAALGIIGLIIK
jgi:hypothetical protein